MSLIERIKRHEGFRELPYDDATGRTLRNGDTIQGTVTIGYGFARLSKPAADAALAVMLDEYRAHAVEVVGPTWVGLSQQRRDVLTEMCYQLGRLGLLGFVSMLNAVRDGRHEDVPRHMLASKWAQYQSPGRAQELADLYREG